MKMGLENKLSRKILPAVALASALGYGNVQAQDRIFSDEFETSPVNNIIGFEEGFEGTRPITANICDHDEKGIASVMVRYQSVVDEPSTQRAQGKYKASKNSKFNQSVRGTDGWVEVSLEPQGDGGTRQNIACEPYETTSALPLEYGVALDDNGLIEWEFQVNYSDGTVDFHPETSPKRSMYWANENTAQQTIEDVLNNDSNVLVLCYDCNINLDSNSEGPYDANIFFNGSSNLYAIEYNGENYSEQRIQELRDFYQDPINGRYFHLISPSAKLKIIENLNDLSQSNINN